MEENASKEIVKQKNGACLTIKQEVEENASRVIVKQGNLYV